MNFIFIALIVLAGMGLSFEAGLLGPLGEEVGHLWATLSILGGDGIALVDSFLYTEWEIYRLEFHSKVAACRRLLGPIYVVVLTLATPLLGVAMTMICVLLGQITKSFAIDYFGWFGVKKQATNLLRLVALVLVGLALCFVYLGAQ
ncbi:DMT family transporter [Vibrio variabilis]|uniref:DMT family transporter n=1 Tax=Vibrio variabilis TaxID=990271 RepID=UPI000DD7F5BA|nr:DMT family transporter [Vibrio variabilis]